MDYIARIRRIEKVVSLQPKDERLIVFYDEQSASRYEPQPNDFIIVCDYGELLE